MADGLQQRLDQSMYGTPKVNPDEQRKYLGTFRERCYLQMSMSQMKDTRLQQQFQVHLKDFPNATCLVNGAVNENIQAIYISLLVKAGLGFTIVSTEQVVTDDTVGLLLVAKEAVNESVIDISKKYDTLPNEEVKPMKRSFFSKLFG